MNAPKLYPLKRDHWVWQTKVHFTKSVRT